MFRKTYKHAWEFQNIHTVITQHVHATLRAAHALSPRSLQGREVAMEVAAVS